MARLGFDPETLLELPDLPPFDGTNGPDTVYRGELTEEQIMWRVGKGVPTERAFSQSKLYRLIAAATDFAEEMAEASKLPPYTVPKLTLDCFTTLIDSRTFPVVTAMVLATRGYHSMPGDPEEESGYRPAEFDVVLGMPPDAPPDAPPEVQEESRRSRRIADAVAAALGDLPDSYTAIPIRLRDLDRLPDKIREAIGQDEIDKSEEELHARARLHYDGTNEADTAYGEEMSRATKAWTPLPELPVSKKDQRDPFRLVFVNIVKAARNHSDELGLPPAATAKLAFQMMRGLESAPAAAEALRGALVELGYRNIPDLPMFDYSEEEGEIPWNR